MNCFIYVLMWTLSFSPRFTLSLWNVRYITCFLWLVCQLLPVETDGEYFKPANSLFSFALLPSHVFWRINIALTFLKKYLNYYSSLAFQMFLFQNCTLGCLLCLSFQILWMCDILCTFAWELQIELSLVCSMVHCLLNNAFGPGCYYASGLLS